LTEPDLTFSLVQPAPDGGVRDAAPAIADAAAATGDARPPARCTRNARNMDGRNPGPRHMDFSQDGKRAYLLTEYGASVHVFDIAASDGKLQGSGLAPVQLVSVIPPAIQPMVDFVTLGVRAAEIFFHPTGRWLYTSVRFDRCDYNPAGMPAFQADREDGYVTRFAVGNDGRLSDPQYVKVNKEPRYFGITPDGNFLVVAGQRAVADNVLVYKIDTSAAGAGKLVEPPVGKATTGRTWDGREPNQSRSIVFFKKP
jgi:6-phosphogluconolactonase (cycloisomerase 2 family)